MGGSNFDIIAQEIQQQQRLMEELEGENRKLRQQIAHMRAGHGIAIEICGKRYMLQHKNTTAASTIQHTAPEVQHVIPQAPNVQQPAADYSGVLTPTDIALPHPVPRRQTSSLPGEEQHPPTHTPEAMLEAFAEASTTPITVSVGSANGGASPSAEKQQVTIQNEKQESFLL